MKGSFLNALNHAMEVGASETAKRIERLGGKRRERPDEEVAEQDEELVSTITEDSVLTSLDGVSATEVDDGHRETLADDVASDEVDKTREHEATDDVVSAMSGEDVFEVSENTDYDATRPMPVGVDDGMYEYLSDVQQTEHGSRRTRNRAERTSAAGEVFGSTQKAASFEDMEQTRRMRNVVTRFDRKSFDDFKDMHLGAANRKAARDKIRRAQISRRQTYRQLAITGLFQGETLFDGLASAAGYTVGFLISGGLGCHVNRRTGLTRTQSVAKRLDGMVDWFEKRANKDEAIVDGLSQRKRNFWLDRVLIPARDRMHWLVGQPIPESASTLATYQLSIMTNALDEMSRPDADVLDIRRRAGEDMRAIYEIAAHDGISANQLNMERDRIGRRLDGAEDASCHLRFDFDGSEVEVESKKLSKAFNLFMSGNTDIDAIRAALSPQSADERAAQQRDADTSRKTPPRPDGTDGGASPEKVMSADEEPSVAEDESDGIGAETVTVPDVESEAVAEDDAPVDDSATVSSEGLDDADGERGYSNYGVARRKLVDESELHRGSVRLVRVGPYFDDSVPPCENVADVLAELRHRGTFGDVRVYDGGAMESLGLTKADLPQIVNAYRFGAGDNSVREDTGRARPLANSVRRVSEMLMARRASDGVTPMELDMGLTRDLDTCANDLYEGGFDITDPWGQMRRSFDDLTNYISDAEAASGHYGHREAAKQVGNLIIDLMEHKPGEPFKFGNIGNIEPNHEPSELDDVADRLRFAFACDPVSQYVFANAVERNLVRQDKDNAFESFFTKDKNGESHLSYFELDERTHNSVKSPLEAIEKLGDTLDIDSLSAEERNAAAFEIGEEIDLLKAWSPIVVGSDLEAFAPLVSEWQSRRNDEERIVETVITPQAIERETEAAEVIADEAQAHIDEVEREHESEGAGFVQMHLPGFEEGPDGPDGPRDMPVMTSGPVPADDRTPIANGPVDASDEPQNQSEP